MIIKYFFTICALLLIFLSIVKASECKFLPRETSITVNYSISKSDLFLSKQRDYLLNKVILPTHPGDHDVFWKNMIFLFETTKRVYTNLGMYLYYSIFSIFKW